MPLEEHLKNGQIDLSGQRQRLVLPPSRVGQEAALPIIRDVHGPLEQIDRIVSDLEQTGVIDHAAWLRMAELLSVIYRGDRDPTWGESRRMFERICKAVGQSEPEEPEEQDLIDMGYRRDDDDDVDRELSEPEPPPTVGPETWPAWTAEEAAAAGQGNIEL